MATETTDTTFQKDVLESDNQVLVEFWAPWCAPCRMLGPIIDELAEDIGDQAKIYKLNIDDNQNVAQRYRITSVPAVIIFKNGEIHKQMIGVQPKQNYKLALL